MCAGTVRIGEMMPGAMRPSSPLWHRLYLRPEPHQQSSLDWGRTAGALARVRGVDSEPFIAHHSTDPPFSATLDNQFQLSEPVVQSGDLVPLFTHFGIWLPPSGKQIPKWRVIAGEGDGSNDLFIVKAP